MSVLRSSLAREASRQILDTLARAPRTVAELRGRWPVTRALVQACLTELEARGEVQIVGVGAGRVARRVRPPGKNSFPDRAGTP